MNIEAFKRQVSEYARKGVPFIFIVDFELKKPILLKLSEAAEHNIYFDFQGKTNIQQKEVETDTSLESIPIEKRIYKSKFNNVFSELNKGNSYLTNLTFASEVKTNLSLEDIFHKSQASYKLLYKKNFVVFSPECFIKIENDMVFTYPMKGTIDANIKDAENSLLNNEKETNEHNTIVDLMRNDLAMIAKNITVENYRYVEKIQTNKGTILQTSSKISGKLKNDWQKTLGENIIKLLPAGSISGAPKQKTVEIIKQNELLPREYYTGVFGIFDEKKLDSAVAIRFIENKNGTKFYRSGGGITAKSNVEDEYNELIQKIYIPVKNEHPLCESIRVEDGIIQNIEWHQKRYEHAYTLFYGNNPNTKLLDTILIPKKYKKGIVKMRVVYNATEKKIMYEAYTLKNIKTLKIVYDDEIDYSLKYTNRSHLNKLYDKREKCDDILIVKNGIITDSYYANIVFFDGLNWITPSSPLLKGTAREKLIKSKILIEQKITINCLKKFKSFKLINSMRDFEKVQESDITNIQGYKK